MHSEAEENAEIIRIQVAERLGWTSVEYNHFGYLVGHPPGKNVFRTVPSFATDIRAAWELIDLLYKGGVSVTLQKKDIWGNRTSVEMSHAGKVLAHSENLQPALALCQAYLQVSGGDGVRPHHPLRLL